VKEPQDFIFIAVKAYSMDSVAESIGCLFGPHTRVLTTLNGIPFWFFSNWPGSKWENTRLFSVDPLAIQSDKIPHRMILGCVVFSGASSPKPGYVKSAIDPQFFKIGELDGTESKSCLQICDMLNRSGIRVHITPDIRVCLMEKLWAVCVCNPVAALTGTTLEQLVTDPNGITLLITEGMLEFQNIANAIGISFSISLDERLRLARNAAGPHKPSMLQDIEKSKCIEIEVLTAPLELARLVKIPTPTLINIMRLVHKLAEIRGCLP